MRSLKRFFTRLQTSATRGRDEGRLRDEIEEHLALQTAENLRSGLPPDEARRQAVLKFGSVEQGDIKVALERSARVKLVTHYAWQDRDA